jgi:hypothetical protein
MFCIRHVSTHLQLHDIYKRFKRRFDAPNTNTHTQKKYTHTQLQDMYKRFKRRFEISAAEADDANGWTPAEERKTSSKRIRAHVDEDTPATAKKPGGTEGGKFPAKYFGQHDNGHGGSSSSLTAMAGSVRMGDLHASHPSFSQQWNAFQAK